MTHDHNTSCQGISLPCERGGLPGTFPWGQTLLKFALFVATFPVDRLPEFTAWGGFTDRNMGFGLLLSRHIRNLAENGKSKEIERN